MSIKATLSSDGLEEVYTPPTLKEMCLYKCLTNKKILTKEVKLEVDSNGREKLKWEKFRLKEPVQKDLVEALLDAGNEYLFMLTPNYAPVLAAIRMSQPEHLVKVNVSNTETLKDHQLEWLISGGNVKSLDINGCFSLKCGSLVAINKFGSKLEYLRIGPCFRILPDPSNWEGNSPILRTPNLKTVILSEIYSGPEDATNYWRSLLHDFISNLEDLQISGIDEFETLEFLEPAKSKLTVLSLRDCVVGDDANAWASLFKLHKLRFLDVVGSSIGKAFEGENVVQRLLTAMPDLNRLAIDPGLVKDISVENSIRGRGSVAKRLEFLGIMDNEENTTDEFELRTAKRLANDVAYLGTVEGELRILEHLSNRLNVGQFDSTLELLLKRLIEEAPWKTILPFFFPSVKPLFTPDIWTKLGEVLQDQCIRAISAYMSRWSMYLREVEPQLISDVIDIMMNLEGELRFDDYLTVVTIVMSTAEITMTKSVLYKISMDEFKDLLKKIAQLLENAVDRFPGESNALWGISSLLIVMKELKDVIVSASLARFRFNIMEIFGSPVTSLRKLCLNSGPRRAAFHTADGVDIVMELLAEIIDGCLGLADRDSFSLALLEKLQSILQDTKINLSESVMFALRLEKLLLSLHSKWEFGKPNCVRETTHYYQFESIARLLNILENDPRYDYEVSADVKEIMMKLK